MTTAAVPESEPAAPNAFYLTGPPAVDPPSTMDHHEKMRMRAAAFRAKKLYPGPVGELISRELLAWEDFGYRIGGNRLVTELVDHVMKATPERPSA